MQGVTLENDRLRIQVNETGAELSSIYDREKKREVLWDAKPEIWNRHAPMLFPFVGKCFEASYRHDGTDYPMGPHGFARDQSFDLVSLSGEEVCYRLKEDETSLAVYPFHFTLEVIHKLEGNKLRIIWKVTNDGDAGMWFMIGGHPAFQVPEGYTIHDYTLRFDTAKPSDLLHYEAPNQDGYAVADLQGNLELDHGKVPVRKGFFEDVLTYIFDRGQVERVSLLLPGEEPYVTVHCQGFPYLGVWSIEKTHPFVCLEPWFGRCADAGFKGELKDRAGVMSLDAGACFQAEYVIEIH